jgi:predicted PurR-regulated permease PerM
MTTQPPERSEPGLGASTVTTPAPTPAPAPLPRSLILLIGVLGVVALGIGVKAAAGIIAPTMLALVLTIAVLPIDAAARRHGWPGWLATLAALVASYAILLVLLAGTVICIVRLVNLLPSYASNFADISDKVEKWLKSIGLDTGSTTDALKKINPDKIVDVLTGTLSTILDAAGGVFFLVTLMFFFVAAVPGFGPRVAALARSKPQLAGALGQWIKRTQRYLIVTALFGAIVAVLDTGALLLLGVPLAVAWGFFSFITNFIPNIGFVIGVIPPALIALLDSGWELMLVVILVYCVLNVTIQTFIQPRFVGATVGLSAEMTFMSLVVWTFLLGALGALLAVPMTLLARAFFLDSDPRTAWVAPLIDTQAGEDPPPA